MTTGKDYKQSITSIDEDEMSISDTLSKLQVERIKRGISQKAFAEWIEMKPTTIGKNWVAWLDTIAKNVESVCAWTWVRDWNETQIWRIRVGIIRYEK